MKSWHTTGLVVLGVAVSSLGFVWSAPQVLAQQNIDAPATGIQSLGVAHYVTVTNQDELRDGMILSHVDNQYQITPGEFDKSIVGVYTQTPAMALEPENTEGQVPMMTGGNVRVLVNTSGGTIQAGDYVTSSSTPGIGMKASQSGFMLGVAQEDFDGTPDETGMITVMMDIKFAYAADAPESEFIMSRLLTVLNASRLAAVEDPIIAFRTLMASVLVILAILIAIITFARVAQRGIEALGRNPLASQRITIGIVLNLAISAVIIAAGFAAAYFVLRI